MVTEETIVCNYPAYVGEDVKRLNLFGTDTVNVFPQISLFKEYFKNINPRLIDFVEIATFIYVADQMIVRCQNRVDPHGFLWRRKFNMVVAVQDYDFWCRADVTKTLERLLRFLSDDCFHFQFVKMTEKHPEQEYWGYKLEATKFRCSVRVWTNTQKTQKNSTSGFQAIMNV